MDLLSLLVAGTMTLPVPSQVSPRTLQLTAQVFEPARTTGVQRPLVDLGTTPTVLFVHTGTTLCEGLSISTNRPMVAGNGWRVELTAANGAVTAAWQRLWENGKTVTGDRRTTSIRVTADASITLDSIDGAARQQAKVWTAADPLPAFASANPIAVTLKARLSEAQRSREQMARTMAFGDKHPKMVENADAIAFLTRELERHVAALATDARPDGACSALSMSLGLRTSRPSADEPVFEVEYWLIHRDPAGKETTQRQVVRTRRPNGASAYFDDIVVDTPMGKVTIESFVTSGAPLLEPDGSLGLNLGVSRRYVTSGAAATWRMKEGSNDFGPRFRPGEVVSLLLPPMPGDDGLLVGHRFSLRVRMSVLK